MPYQRVPVNNLKPHPKNSYYFDDMSGEKWEEFLDSIKVIGIKDPIIITQDNVIVSGHQRIRAAKELGIAEVDVIQYDYQSEDDVLRDLIELNIKQRGVMADSETKAGRRFKELKRIYGVQHGGDRKSSAQVASLKSFEQLAEENGISKSKMNRTIQVADSDPKLQDWNVSGKISGDTIRYMMSQLSPQEREEFYANNEDVEKIRKKDVVEFEKLKKENASISSENSRLKSSLAEKDEEIDYLLNEAGNPAPDSGNDERYAELQAQHDKEISEYRTKIDTMSIELDALRRSSNPGIADMDYGSEIFDFCNECTSFVMKIAKLQYSDAFRKIKTDRSVPLNTLEDSCAKLIDALNELVKHIKTDSYIDVY